MDGRVVIDREYICVRIKRMIPQMHVFDGRELQTDSARRPVLSASVKRAYCGTVGEDKWGRRVL